MSIPKGGNLTVLGKKSLRICPNCSNKALDIDPEYDLAWFNLGGQYWNFGAEEEAIKTWKEAINRFPDHDLAKELQQQFPDFLTK